MPDSSRSAGTLKEYDGRLDKEYTAIYGCHMTLAKTTLYLPEADYRRLKALARLQNRPAAELIREAIAEYTERHGKKRRRPRSLGAGHSGRGDLSEKAEELLVGLGDDG